MSSNRFTVPVVGAIAFVGATVVTEPTFVGDTPYYAVSALARILGGDCRFLEPGHLLWRPVAFAVLTLSGIAESGASTDHVLRGSQAQLAWLVWMAALATILTTTLWAQRLAGPVGAVFGGAVLLSSKAFLNYSQVGTSYVPALAFLMGAILLLQSDGTRSSWATVRGLMAGCCLGVSVLMWGTFVLALPAALALPILFWPDRRRGIIQSALAVAGGSVVALVALGWVSKALGFSSHAQLLSWAGTADHGIALGGAPRAILGFARSFVSTGDYGRLVRRFIVADPNDPVQLIELASLPLLGIAGFYCGLAFAMVTARHHSLRTRALAFLAINAIPVAAFAAFWQGGDLERYLPLTPGIVLLSALAFARATGIARGVLITWLLVIALPNVWTSSLVALDREEQRIMTRLEGVGAVPRYLLVLSHGHDELAQFSHNHPARLPSNLSYYALLTSGAASPQLWPQALASRISAAWNANLEVLVSERLLVERPQGSWRWVEGDHSPVHWSDFYRFFRGLSYGGRLGPPVDGFLVLDRSESNIRTLATHPSEPPTRHADGCRLPTTLPSRRIAGQDAERASVTPTHGNSRDGSVTSCTLQWRATPPTQCKTSSISSTYPPDSASC